MRRRGQTLDAEPSLTGGTDDPEARLTAERAEAGKSAALVARIQAGETEAFSGLYSLYVDRVYAYLRVILNSAHEAEDATQQVFLKVFESLPRYRAQGRPFQAWLFTVARNHALSHLRKHGRIDPVDPTTLNGDDIAESHLDGLGWISDQDLLFFVGRLSIPQRQVLLLRYMLDLTIAQTAQVLHRPEGDVASLQHRALRSLAKSLIATGHKPEPGRPEPKAPDREHPDRMRRYPKQSPVLRGRRWAMLSR